jgi:ferrous iron transport protein A
MEMCTNVELCKCELVAFTSRALKSILRGVKSPDLSTPNTSVPLAELKRGDLALVSGLEAVAALQGGTDDAALLTRLRDLGFIAGARCEVVARMWFGGDPLVVRIGGSTFALRRAEAAAVRVQRLQEQVRPRAALEPKDASAATA